MADRLITIDTAKAAGQRLPVAVRSELAVLIPTIGGGAPTPGSITLQMLVAGIQATLAKADTALQSIGANTVGSTQIADGSVALADLSAAVQASLAHADAAASQTIPNNSIGSQQLADGGVNLVDLSASLQTAVGLANTALQSIAANSIGSTQLIDGGVSLVDLASNVQAMLSAASTALQSVPVNSVGSAQVTDGSLTAADFNVAVQAAITLAGTAVQPAALDAKAANLVPTAVKTAAYPAAVSDFVPVDASLGAVTITLPTAPADKARVAVKKIDTSTNAVTVALAGGDVLNKAGGNTSLGLQVANQGVVMQYRASGAIWYVVSTDVPLSGLDTRYQPVMARRPANNRAAALGDSITELGTDGLLYAPQNGEGWFPRLCIAVRQRIRYDAIYAKGGATLVSIRDTYLPMVLAQNPRPGACFVFGGTNSMLLAHTANVATYLQIVEPLMAVGITPICVTIPPNDLNSGAFSAAVRQWNRWLRRYAQRTGLPLLDAYNACVALNGSWKAGYSDDSLHPNAVGMKAIAAQGAKDGLDRRFPPNNGPLTARESLDTTNLFSSGSLNWGLFTTNSGGVGTGLTSGGTGTASIVAAVTADDVMGNWQRIARASGDAGAGVFQVYSFLSGYSPGDRLALSFRVKTANVTPAAPITVGTKMTKSGGFTQNGQNVSELKQGLFNVAQDIEGLVHVEFDIPAGGIDALLFNALIIGNTSGQTVTVDFAELTIVNLTTGGALT